MRHRLVITAALLLALAGCSDDSPAPKASASTATASPSPSPTGPPAPAMPAAAKENTQVGAKAFVRYWFEAVTYAMQTGETTPLTAASAPSCRTCESVLDGIDATYASHGQLLGSGWAVKAIRNVDDRSDGKHIYVFVRQGKQIFVNEEGSTVSTSPAKSFGAELLVTWGDGWRVRELALL